MAEIMDATLDELGPVDYLVVEFPAGAQNFTGEMAEELARLSSAGIVRILDLLILQKNEDGSVDALEVDDVPGGDEIRASRPRSPRSWRPRTSSTWPRRCCPAALPACWSGRTDGRPRSRVPPGGRVVSSSPTAGSRSRPSPHPSRPNWPRKKGTDMPLRPARAARRGVIGAPVARTAATVGTVAVVAHGVNRRGDRREDRRDDRGDRRR